MREQDLEAGIAMLLEEMAQKPEDAHELFLKLQEMLNVFRAEGLPIPEDLARLEAELEEEFAPGAGPPEIDREDDDGEGVA
ncbi:MAG: hypothetical protein IRY94_04705 [Rhodospirillaceae bacterium]|nr:hypothetical protein [Rhodospirillaceae bacterium]